MDAVGGDFSPDEANRLELWQKVAIVLISVIAVAMIFFGAAPILPFSSGDVSLAQTVLCVLLMLSGVFVLYSVLFNIFRIIERNQRRKYEWEGSRIDRGLCATGHDGDSTGE